MLGDIDEETFKIKIQQDEKKRLMYTIVTQILQMFVQVITDLMRQFVAGTSLSEIVNSLHNIQTYTNDEFKKVRKNYNRVVPIVLAGFEHVIVG
jgi:hypothetical protein